MVKYFYQIVLNEMKAEIITIGDEILIGQIVDTNSAWMANLLYNHGIEVAQITSITDEKNHIVNAKSSISIELYPYIFNADEQYCIISNQHQNIQLQTK